MDADHFDALARPRNASGTRRTALGAILSETLGLLGLLGLLGPGEAQAKQNQERRGS